MAQPASGRIVGRGAVRSGLAPRENIDRHAEGERIENDPEGFQHQIKRTTDHGQRRDRRFVVMQRPAVGNAEHDKRHDGRFQRGKLIPRPGADIGDGRDRMKNQKPDAAEKRVRRHDAPLAEKGCHIY